MKEKKFILWILMSIALLIVAIPTIPHHHHSATTICLNEPEYDEQGEPIHPIDHGTCEAGCITHIKAIKSDIDQATTLKQTDIQLFKIIFNISLLTLLADSSLYHQHSTTYLERYYHTFLHPNHGLRAPPFIFG